MPRSARAYRQVGNPQFEDIVLGGLWAPLGMPAFDDRLSAEEVRRIQADVLESARESVGER